MDTFSIVRESLADAITISPKVIASISYANRSLAEDAGPVMAAVQTVVDVIVPPDGGGKFSVGFAPITTAATSLDDRLIIISANPLTSTLLNRETAAVVIATLAAHEIGHTIITSARRRSGILPEKSAMTSLMAAITNLADDVVLERYMEDRFPILAGCFRYTGDWIIAESLIKKGEAARHPVLNRKSRASERFNVAILALRYPIESEFVVWDNAAAIRLRDRVIDWGQDLIALDVKDHRGFMAACYALEAILNEVPDVEDDDDEPEGDDGDTDGDDGEGEGEAITDPGIGEGDDGIDEGDGEGESIEDDSATEATDEKSGDDTSTDDSDGEASDEDGESDSDDDGDDDGGVSTGKDGDDIDGDGDDDGDTDDTSEVSKANDEFDGGDIDSSLDDLTTTADPDTSNIANRAALHYAATGKLAFKGHGATEVHWD